MSVTSVHSGGNLTSPPDDSCGKNETAAHLCPNGPRSAEPNAPPAAGPSFATRRDGSAPLPVRVLIADDYADAGRSLALVLSIAGIEIALAMDGEEALDCANAWHPHICVLDLVMPKLDGRDIARRIREQVWSTRPLLIALTGRTTAQDRRGALEAGFDHYMTKPADPATLVRIIQGYMGSNSVSDSCI
jgi:CheY-like chemotaxis protein